MGQIPIYETKVTPQTAPQSQISEELFTSGGKLISEAGEKLGAIASKFKELRDTRQASKASTDFQIELQQLESLAEKDPDIDHPQKYQEQINQISEKHLSTIQDPQTRMAMSDKFRLTGYSSFVNINNYQRKRQIEVTQNESLRGLGVSHESYISTVDLAQRDLIKKTEIEKLDGYVRSGIYSAESANAIRNDITENWDKDWIINQGKGHIVNDPVGALAELRKKEGGLYAGISPHEKSQLVDMATREISKIRYETNQSRIVGELKVVNEVLNGKTYGITDVQNMIGSGEIRQEFGESFIKYLTKPEQVESLYRADPDKKILVSAVEGIFVSNDRTTINDRVREALEGGADGKISQDEMTIIMMIAQKRSAGLINLERTQSKSMDYKVESGIEEFDAGFASLSGYEDKPSMYADYVDNVIKKGLVPSEAAAATIRKNAIKRDPSILKIPKEGEIRIDGNGNKARMFPDGSWFEFDYSKGKK